MPPKYSPEQYAKRVHQLLLHAHEYRLVLGFTAAHVFNDGVPFPHVLKTVCDEGLLDGMARSIPGGLSYYVLSLRGYARIGVTPPRVAATPLQGATLDLAIATLWFSCGGSIRRYRLNADEQAELFETAIPANVPVVVSDELGETKVFRVVHAVGQSPSDTVRKIRQLADQLGRHAKLGTMLSQQQLGLAVLSPNSASLRALEKSVAKSGVSKDIAVITGLGPTADTLGAVIKDTKGAK
jgi:hypothetical protein